MKTILALMFEQASVGVEQQPNGVLLSRDLDTRVHRRPARAPLYSRLARLVACSPAPSFPQHPPRSVPVATAPDVRAARLEEACTLAGFAIERHKIGATEPHYRRTAGRAYLLVGRTGEALEHLRRAVDGNLGHVGMRADLAAAMAW